MHSKLTSSHLRFHMTKFAFASAAAAVASDMLRFNVRKMTQARHMISK